MAYHFGTAGDDDILHPRHDLCRGERDGGYAVIAEAIKRHPTGGGIVAGEQDAPPYHQTRHACAAQEIAVGDPRLAASINAA